MAARTSRLKRIFLKIGEKTQMNRNDTNIDFEKRIKELSGIYLGVRIPDKKLSAPIVAVIAVLCSASMVYSGKTSEYLSLFGVAAVLIFMICTVRRPGPYFMMFAFPALLFGISNGVRLPALYICFIFTVSAVGMLIAYCESAAGRVAVALIPLASYLTAYAITQRPIFSLFALLPYPMAAVMGYTYHYQIPAVSRICRMAAAIVVTLAAAFGIYLFVSNGYINADLIFSAIESGEQSLIDAFVKTAEENMIKLYGSVQASGMQPFIDAVVEMIKLIVSFLPSIIIALSSIVAFIVDRIGSNICIMDVRMRTRIKPQFIIFRMSLISAIVFVFAFLVALFTSSDPDIVSHVAKNIAVALAPGLVFIGFSMLMSKSSGKRGLGFITIILTAFAIMFNIILAAVVLALIGVYAVISGYIAERIFKKKFGSSPFEDLTGPDKDGDDGDGDDDGDDNTEN